MKNESGAYGNSQVAPYPDMLRALVERLKYRDGWAFWLEHKDRGQGSIGLTLVILCDCVDSYDPPNQRAVAHYFPVPPAAYDERSWQRWLFEQFLLVERHECMEFFRLRNADGKYVRPYAPSHGPGNDPYLIRERGTDADARARAL